MFPSWHILQASPQYSAFPWLLFPYISYTCAYFVLRRHWNTVNQLKMNLNHWKITTNELYSDILVYTLFHYCKNKAIYRLPRWSLPYFVESANETSQQLKDNYLITTWIVNRASRATHANWVSWQMRVSQLRQIPRLESCLRNNFTILFWNIFLNLYTVPRLRNKQKHRERLIKKFRPCISSKDCLRVFTFRD